MSLEEYRFITRSMGGLRAAATHFHELRDYAKRDEACRKFDDHALQLIKARKQ